MEKSPAYLKVFSIIGLLTSLIGLIVAFKIPGNIALIPLSLGLIISFLAFITAKAKRIKCIGSYIALAISIIGIITTLIINVSTEPTVAVDKNQEQIIEQTNDSITQSNELDATLDELDDLE
jgi:hypothetical protein